MVNKVILVGRLGRDPEVKHLAGGKAVANFSIATDESFKDRDGERQKKTEWHNIVAWGATAESAGKYLRKGSLVYVEGALNTRKWEKDGQTRKKNVVIRVLELSAFRIGASVWTCRSCASFCSPSGTLCPYRAATS